MRGKRTLLTSDEVRHYAPGCMVVVPPSALRVNATTSVYTALYRWLVDDMRVPESNFYRLHNFVVAGDKAMKRLEVIERERLHKTGLRGDRLKNAMMWSNMNAGPLVWIPPACESRVSGDVVILMPEAFFIDAREVPSR